MAKTSITVQFNGSCEWAQWVGASVYATGCKNTFEFLERGVQENHFLYCPYCGGKIIEVANEQ